MTLANEETTFSNDDEHSEELEDAVKTDDSTQDEDAGEEKSFEDMTEDDKLNLSDDDLIKHLEAKEDEENKTDTSPDKKADDAKEEDDSKKDEDDKTSKDGADEELVLSQEEIDDLTPKQRGVYYSSIKDRERWHEKEKENERLQELNKNQIQIMKNMQSGDRKTQDDKPTYKSENEAVMAEIEAKAAAYKEEYGEDYRLTFEDTKMIDQARSNDYQRHQQEAAKNNAISQLDHVTRTAETTYKAKLGDDNDYEHVYKTFIEPAINPNIAVDKQAAMRHAQALINIAASGGDPAAYAYEHLARTTPEGRAYFANKTAKVKNESDAERSSKKIIKSTSHLDSTKATTGKTRYSAEDIANDSKLCARLTDAQCMQAAETGEVYV